MRRRGAAALGGWALDAPAAAEIPGCCAACSACSRQSHGLLRYPGGGMLGDRARTMFWGQPHAGDFPRGGKDSEAPPLRPVGVPAPPAWRVPECNRTCRWGNRGGWCGAQPLTGGTVSTAVGVLQPGTTEQGGEASVPCAVALTRPVVGPLGRTCVNGGVCLLCTRVSRFGRGQIGI